MGRGTPSSVTTPFRAETSGQVWCLDIATGAETTPALRVTTYDGDVVIGSDTFSPHPLNIGTISIEDHGEAGYLSVQLGDADAGWKALQDDGADFQGKRVKAYRTSVSALAAGAAATDTIRDDFIIEKWRRVQGGVELTLRSFLGFLDFEVPKRTVTRRDYPGIPDVNTV